MLDLPSSEKELILFQNKHLSCKNYAENIRILKNIFNSRIDCLWIYLVNSCIHDFGVDFLTIECSVRQVWSSDFLFPNWMHITYTRRTDFKNPFLNYPKYIRKTNVCINISVLPIHQCVMSRDRWRKEQQLRQNQIRSSIFQQNSFLKLNCKSFN